ncbi:hypothetical protein A0H81_11112 [Grifola frondosa]|uniref:Uncharacterized protein n=1 Tax=Grifola frondosa TaxID=5627 RepID=A0A1C7LW39_GRIFR|nr:hypothetical protein A0H81_11112 [Grifola frondosa]
MAPPPWTTPAELAWLKERAERYLGHQKQGTLPKFWTELLREWHSTFPEKERLFGADVEQLSPEQTNQYEEALKFRTKRLKEWFANHHNPKGRSAMNVKPLAAAIATKIKKTRLPTMAEVYSTHYYDERIKPRVEAELQGKEVSQGQRLVLIRRLASEMFSNESDGVKAEIVEERARLQLVKAAKPDKGVHVTDVDQLSPELIQKNIDDLPAVVGRFLEDITMATGYSFSLLGGGPSPKEGGRIRTFSYHLGRNSLGLDFSDVFGDFQKTVIGPYGQFLQGVYPPEVCARRVLFPIAASPSTSRLSDDSASPSSGVATPFIHPESSMPSPMAPSPAPDWGSSTSTHPASLTPNPAMPPPSLNVPNLGSNAVTSASPSSPPLSSRLGDIPPTQQRPLVGTLRELELYTMPRERSQTPSSVPFGHTFEGGRSLARTSQEPAPASTATAALGAHASAESLAEHQLPSAANAVDGELAIMPSNREPSATTPSDREPLAPTTSPDREPPPSISASPEQPSPATSTPLERPASTSLEQPLEQPLEQRSSPSSTHLEHSLSSTAPPPQQQRLPSTPIIVPNDSTSAAPEQRSTAPEARPKRTIKPPKSQMKRHLLQSDAYAYLSGAALGPQWKECVESWWLLESQFSRGSGGRLPPAAKIRPQNIGNWIIAHRPLHNVPVIQASEASTFGAQWMAWWMAMQPNWRKTTETSLPIPVQPSGGGWGPLRKGGSSGFVLIMVGLAWWGLAAAASADWLLAVEDVHQALLALNAAPDNGRRPSRKARG